MKTKAQKQEELKRGKELWEKSDILIFTDFTKVTAEQLRRLRQEMRKIGAAFLVIKKRLLGILFKEQRMEFDPEQFKTNLGTIFASDIEKSSGALTRLLKELGLDNEKILGGYDLKHKVFLNAEHVQMIGSLPPREALLVQLAGLMASPIRSLLYVLKEKSQRS